MQSEGLPITALIATASVIFVMWILYAFRIIKVTDRFITGNESIAIRFGIIVVFVAAFNILLDFRFMNDAIQQQLPSYIQ